MDLAQHPAVRERLGASPTWHELIHLEVVGSTQDEALQRLRDGAVAGLVIVADAQSAGRGRLGRVWRDAVHGPTGPANLAVTATIAPPVRLSMVPLAVGLAVARTLDRHGARPSLKWPNDVLLGPGKVAGILVERHTLPDGAVLLLGCGLNLDWRGVGRDAATATGWSVAEEVGHDVDRGAVLADLLGELSVALAELTDAPALLRAYRRRCATLGQLVRVERPGKGPLEGEAIDLDADGRLVVRSGAGREVVDVGDVIHVRSADTRQA